MTGQQKKYKIKPLYGDRTNALIMLIAVCLISFLIVIFLRTVWYYKYPKAEALGYFSRDVMGVLALPAGISDFFHKPWTFLTHPFIHDNFWHVFANMLWLWAFGYILQDLTGSRKIIPIFLYGSWAGALVFLIAMNLVPAFQTDHTYSTLYGASTGVTAIVIATTTLSPGYRLFPMLGGGIPLWILTAVYVLFNLLSLSSGHPAYLISQAAGALTGFLFIRFLLRGRDWGIPLNYFFDWTDNLFNPEKPSRGKSMKKEIFYRSDQEPYKKISHLTQKRVDEILDKISKKGYDSLSAEEKELLKRAGKEDIL